jgi:autotransporter-associated beta strand protein
VQVATFENLGLAPNSYWNGASLGGGTSAFTSGGASFVNNYSSDYGAWEGWSYSSMTDTTTPGFTNQYSAITGTGALGSATYAVAYAYPDPAIVTFPKPVSITGAYLTNTTYAYLSMLNGDSFEYPFGPNDFFSVTISASNASNQPTGTPVTFTLGAGTDLVNSWTWVSMLGLGNNVKSLGFAFAGSEVGDFGLNTPAYVAVDNLTSQPGNVVWTGTGATNHWSAGGNWAGGLPALGQGVEFASGHGATLNDLPVNTTLYGITFDSTAGNYAISGSAIQLAGDITNASTAAQTIQTNLVLSDSTSNLTSGNGSLILSGNISGSGGLAASSSGLIVLSGSNSFSGGLAVSAGTLLLDGAASLSAGSSLLIGSVSSNDSSYQIARAASNASPPTVTTVPEPPTWSIVFVAVLTIFTLRRLRPRCSWSIVR